MFKIRTKLLLVFSACVLFLTLSGFYGYFLNETVSNEVNNSIVIEKSSSELVVHFTDINNILVLFTIASSDKLPALRSEYEFSKTHLVEVMEKMRSLTSLAPYIANIDNLVNKNSDLAEKVFAARAQQDINEGVLGEMISEIRAIRHDLANKFTGKDGKILLAISQMSYKEKEFIFQYKDKQHLKEWFKSIDDAKNEYENGKDTDILSLFDRYTKLSVKISDTLFAKGELRLKNEYYLDNINNILVEYNIVLNRVNFLLKEYKDNVAKESGRQRTIALFLIFISFGTVVYVGRVLANHIDKPIQELVKTAQVISSGNTNIRAKINADDEIGYLARAFNMMLDSIQSSNEKLKEEYDKFHAILLSMGEGLLVVNKDANIILLNKKAEKLLGLEVENTIGKSIKKVITLFKDGKELPFSDWPAKRTLLEGKPVNITVKDNIYYKSVSGRMFPVEVNTAPLMKDGVLGVVVVFRDASELKRAEEDREFALKNTENALKSIYIERNIAQEQKNKIEAILNSIGDAVFAIDKEKKIIIFNQAAENITGFKFSNLRGKIYNKYLKFLDEVTRVEKTKHIDRALNREVVSADRLFVLLTKSGTPIYVEERITPITNQKNEIIGCIVVFRDVTAKRKLEMMRSDFISIASHQLRTPLSATKWFLEILVHGDVGPLKKKQMEVVREAYINNQSMINLVNTMLSMSRIESKQLVINLENVNLMEMTQKIINELRPTLDKKNQTIKLSGLKDKNLVVETDSVLLKNVLDNLIINSSRYSPSNTDINVKIRKKESGHLLFSVEDFGIGIPKIEEYKIFKKFSRANNAITYNASGTGLGLYIAKSILDVFGGKIWFKSKENKGTIFYFSLPIKKGYCKI